MEFANPNKPCVGYSANIRIYAGFGLFEQSEVMRSASAARNSYDTSAAAGYHKLRFQSMTFPLAGVILFLLVFPVFYLLLVTFSFFSVALSLVQLCL